MSKLTLPLCFVAYLFCGIAAADDFRVDNAVYEGNNKKPTTTSVTIFQNNSVYDCMGDETIIFNRIAGRFTLLDAKRRIRTELTVQDVDKVVLTAATVGRMFLISRSVLVPKIFARMESTIMKSLVPGEVRQFLFYRRGRGRACPAPTDKTDGGSGV